MIFFFRWKKTRPYYDCNKKKKKKKKVINVKINKISIIIIIKKLYFAFVNRQCVRIAYVFVGVTQISLTSGRRLKLVKKKHHNVDGNEGLDLR